MKKTTPPKRGRPPGRVSRKKMIVEVESELLEEITRAAKLARGSRAAWIRQTLSEALQKPQRLH
jgi:predicted HicB family RNase H-like nuclease